MFSQHNLFLFTTFSNIRTSRSSSTNSNHRLTLLCHNIKN
nr:MAG TPA: hypothetical protein [Crassvirales sp.]